MTIGKDIVSETEQFLGKRQFKGLSTFIALKVNTKASMHHLVSSLLQIPDVEEVFEVTGEFDIIVIARTITSSALNKVIKIIRMLPGIMSTQSYLALTEHSKEHEEK